MLFNYILIFCLYFYYVFGNQETAELNEPSSCKISDDQSGTCMNLRSCPDLLKLLTYRGHEPPVKTYLRSLKCGVENNHPKVCCPTTSKPNPRIDTDFSQCGKSDRKVIRITGGQNATLGSWPWMAALGYRNSTNPGPVFRCGASLISNKWVVTAAHCTKDLGSWILTTVRVGDLNLDDSVEDGATPIDVAVDEIIPHPDYSGSRLANDVALIRLRNPVTFTKLVHPICVIKNEPKYISDDFYTGKLPYVIGWGSTFYGGPTSNSLLEVQVKIVDNEECAQNYSAWRSSAVIDHRTLCAGEGGKDACRGDSGGPLMMPIESSYYLAGIVSFGRRCAEINYPGVYTRVVQFSDWITKTAGL